MQKITPFLMFDGKTEDALNLYTSIFKNGKPGRITRYGEGGAAPKGSVMSATFQLDGLEFMTFNGGPHFKFTPAVSFFTTCETEEEVDSLWKNLSSGGTIHMELAKYPFSEKYGWVQDRYGISWQLSLAHQPQKVTPFLMYAGAQHGKAEEAMNFYTSIFRNSKIQNLLRSAPGDSGPSDGVKYASFLLEGQEFLAMDGGREHAFTFTEGISFFVNCETQEEVDDFWEKLSAGGQKSRCGWLKDKFGVSWQIIPSALGRYLQDKDLRRSKSVMDAMLKMDKIDIGKLKEAYERP